MLKHKDIIENLSKLEKVAIVASALSPEPFERVGLPPVRIAALDELGKSDAVAYSSAVRSWDPKLIGKMTAEIVARQGVKNNLFVTPDLKTAVCPSKEGLSEDALLNGKVGAEIIRAAHGVGAAVGLSRLSIGEDEIAYIDTDEDYGCVHDLFIKPFLKATEEGRADAVLMNPSREGHGYYDTNRTLLGEVQNGLLGEDVFMICEGENFDLDAVRTLCPKLTLGGCTIPLERAVRRYAQLTAYEAEGSIHHREISEALKNGNAIDDETLDKIVDSVIDFALTLDGLDLIREEQAITRGEASGEQDEAGSGVQDGAAANEEPEVLPFGDKDVSPVMEEVAEVDGAAVAGSDPAMLLSEAPSDGAGALEEIPSNGLSEVADCINGGEQGQEVAPLEAEAAAEETFSEPILKTAAAGSFVLLKNDNKLLPLPSGGRVAVLGEPYSDKEALYEKFNVVGKAKGYDRFAQRSDTLIPAAVRATKNADAAIVFLYPDDSGKLALPANRLALLQALKNAKKSVIAIVVGDTPVDLSFDEMTDALIVAPDDCPYCAEALAEILCGEREPTGRLTRTYYDDADEYFRKYRAARDSKVMRIGSYVGYLRYGLEKTKVRYPFGFGLGYTKFEYSELSVNNGNISFSLTNAGDRDGCEVVQVYIGAPNDAVSGAKKLRAFCKVFLKQGEKKQIEIPLGASDLETYDPSMYTDNVEKGTYGIFVGASPLDIRLRGKKTVNGVVREKDTRSIAELTQNGDYGDVSKTQKEHRVAKKRDDLPGDLGKWRKAAIFAFPVFAMLFFLATSVFVLSYAFDFIMLNTYELASVEQTMFIAAVAMILLVPLLAGLNRKRLMRIRNVALVLLPFVLIALVLYCIIESKLNARGTEIGIEALTCMTIGVPLVALIAAVLDRQLWKSKKGKNSWDKYYFDRETGDRITSDEDFEFAMRAADAAREARASEKKDDSPKIVTDVPQFYDTRLTYEQMLSDCRQFVSESGVKTSDKDIVDYIAALSSTQLIFVPKGGGAALCQAASEYFGRKAYIDNAEKYSRFDDLFWEWHTGGYVSTPTNFAVAIEKAAKETAYLHTVLVRHIDKNIVETLFSPLADVIARRKMTVAVGERSVSLPANVLIVAELESDRVELPEDIAGIAAVLAPVCEDCEPAQRRTIVQTVGFERITAMSRAVRDEHPLDEECWKRVDKLDERCMSGRIANNVWNRLEMHSSVIIACGLDCEEAIDSAMAAELMPWMYSIWDDAASEGSLADALKEIFGEDKLVKCAEFVKAEKGGEDE